jgi:hypothetical protein
VSVGFRRIGVPPARMSKARPSPVMATGAIPRYSARIDYFRWFWTGYRNRASPEP